MVTISMTLAKLTIVGVLKKKIIKNKGCDVITSVHDAANKILSRDSDYILDLVMWPTFGNCGISMKEVIMTSTL